MISSGVILGMCWEYFGSMLGIPSELPGSLFEPLRSILGAHCLNVASSNLKRRTENKVGLRSCYTRKERHHAVATLWCHFHTVALPMASTTQWLSIAETNLVVKVLEVRRLLWGRQSSQDCCLILASSNMKRRTKNEVGS